MADWDVLFLCKELAFFPGVQKPARSLKPTRSLVQPYWLQACLEGSKPKCGLCKATCLRCSALTSPRWIARYLVWKGPYLCCVRASLLRYLRRELLGCEIRGRTSAAGWPYSSVPAGRQALREKSSAATSLPVLVSAALGFFLGGLSFACWPNLTLLGSQELPRSQLKVVWLEAWKGKVWHWSYQWAGKLALLCALNECWSQNTHAFLFSSIISEAYLTDVWKTNHDKKKKKKEGQPPPL